MRGKQLTLEEVLNLEDGIKVLVKEWHSKNERIHTFKKNKLRLVDDSFGYHNLDVNTMEEDIYLIDDLTFYEWIDGVKSINVSGVKSGMNGEYYNKSIVINLAQEICNLRGLDLTDENIRLIVEEFS